MIPPDTAERSLGSPTARLTSLSHTPTAPLSSIGLAASTVRTYAPPTPPPSSSSSSNRNNGDAWRPSPVYTFLATLVLLLSVSAAIVFRSFVLRRRHRLMVEEAIRNGTWNPGMMDGGVGGNGPLGRGGARVDLSKKPRMWETYLGGGGLVGGGAGSSTSGYMGEKGGQWAGWNAGGGGGEVREWDGIKPVSVSYVASTPAPSSKTGSSSSGSAVGGSTASNPPSVHGIQHQQSRGALREAGTFVADLFRTPRMPVPPGAMAGESEEVEMGSVPAAQDGERTVRVAVLIAMPRPPSLTGHSSATSSEASSSSSPQAHPLSATVPPIGQGDGEGEEKPLPVLEIGVAEVTVVVGHDEDGVEEARRMSGESVELKKGGGGEGVGGPAPVV